MSRHGRLSGCIVHVKGLTVLVARVGWFYAVSELEPGALINAGVTQFLRKTVAMFPESPTFPRVRRDQGVGVGENCILSDEYDVLPHRWWGPQQAYPLSFIALRPVLYRRVTTFGFTQLLVRP